jgi:hypothetical protein
MATYVPEPPVNIPRCFRANPSAEYFGSQSIFTGISQYPAISAISARLKCTAKRTRIDSGAF